MIVTITQEAPDTPDARALIAELDELLTARYDASDRHGYSIEKLRRHGVYFFVIRCDGEAAGCGGVEIFGAAANAGAARSAPSMSSVSSVDFGELKRMYVRPRFRGQGLGRRLVDHLSGVVRDHGLDVVRLETGIYQAAAIALYETCGFHRIRPFGDYVESPVSLCFEKRLTS